MTKPPASVRVGPHTYRVRQTRAAHARAEAAENIRLWGRIDHGTMEISLDPTMGPSRARETLLHEALHGLFEAVGGLKESDLKNEDGIITRIQAGLLSLIRDNPDLVAYLQED